MGSYNPFHLVPALHPKPHEKCCRSKDLQVPPLSSLAAQLRTSVTHHHVEEELMHLPPCADGPDMRPLWRKGEERMSPAQQPAAFQNGP